MDSATDNNALMVFLTATSRVNVGTTCTTDKYIDSYYIIIYMQLINTFQAAVHRRILHGCVHISSHYDSYSVD